MSICIPATNLEEMLKNFSARYTRSSKRQNVEVEQAKRQIIMESLTDSELEIKAVFDEFSMDLKEILQMQVSDVIPLSKNIQSDIKIMVDDAPWFSGKLGETKLRKAVKLQNLIS